MGGSRNIFWKFGWVTKFFLKIWVGLEIHLEILGGSWNSPWNFGWVMKNFQTFENVSRPLWTIIHVRSLRPISADFWWTFSHNYHDFSVFLLIAYLSQFVTVLWWLLNYWYLWRFLTILWRFLMNSCVQMEEYTHYYRFCWDKNPPI